MHAPIDGVVTKLNVDALQNVQAGTAIASMIGDDGLKASVNVPADIIARIHQRTNKTAFVVLDAVSDEPIAASFEEATLEADASSQTFKVSFRFTAPEEFVILPGMTATVMLSSSSLVDQSAKTAVPLSAIMSEGDAHYVWLVDPDSMQVSKAEIQVAQSIGESITVTSGLNKGDIIVGAGANYLAEGMEVRAWSSK